MTVTTSPFFNIQYGWSTGDSGWGDPVNTNLKVLSFLDKGAVDDFVSSLPGAPTTGSSYVLTTDNLLYVRFAEGWMFITPQTGMEVTKLSDGTKHQWNGSSWVDITKAKISDLALSSGSSLIGYSRNSILSAITNVHQMLDVQPVSVWEFANLITDKPTPSDPTTWDWSPAVQAAVNTNKPVTYGPGVFIQKSTITYTNLNAFIGSGMLNTVVKYRGSAGTWAFQHSFTTDGSNQWPGRVQFRDLSIEGDGTGNLGAGATVNGIRAADSSSNLINIPYYSLTRVKFDKLQIGLQLEGYAHYIQDCWAEKCLTGYDLTHPEQAMMTGSWANYCDVGLDVNTRKLKPGHMFIINGGAFQRCRIGIRAAGVFEMQVDTYFELNTERDFLAGDPNDPTNYTKGLKNLLLRCHSASNPSVANIDLYATNGSMIDYSGYGGSNTTLPHVQTNGYCKMTVVDYNPEGITSSVPWNFQGNSVLSAIAKVRGGSERVNIPTTGTGYTSVGTNPLGYYLLNEKTVRICGAFSVTTGYSGNIFTLPVGYRPKYQQNTVCPMFAGSWSQTVMQVATNGAVTWNIPGDNRSVYLDITFERDDGFY